MRKESNKRGWKCCLDIIHDDCESDGDGDDNHNVCDHNDNDSDDDDGDGHKAKKKKCYVAFTRPKLKNWVGRSGFFFFFFFSYVP